MTKDDPLQALKIDMRGPNTPNEARHHRSNSVATKGQKFKYSLNPSLNKRIKSKRIEDPRK